MRKIKLIPFVMAILLVTTAVSFIACSQDEAEEDAKQAKIELLKAKAKEFAKKYGVEMSLNEDNMEALAETLTVEQMEEDFMAFAEFKGIKVVSYGNKTLGLKRLKIKRAKTVAEDKGTKDEGNINGRYDPHEGSARAEVYNVKIKGKWKPITVNFTIVVDWRYTLTKANYVKIDISVSPSDFELTHDSSGYVFTTEKEGDVVEAHGIIKLKRYDYEWKLSYSFNHDSKTGETSAQVQ